MAKIKFAPKIFSNTNPWVYFFIFLISNTFLSYFPFPFWIKMGICLLGLFIPWMMACRAFPNPSPKEVPLYQKEFLPAIPIWVWLFVAALALFARFYKLTTLSVWPLYDEGMYGYYASQLSRQWNWQILYGSSQAPPLYLWLLAGTFKWFGVSLFSLWFLPALISSLLFPVSYWAARGFFNRSCSVALAFIFGFSFWPLYVGRFSLMTGLVLLFECLTLGLLARFLTRTEPARKPGLAAALGAMTGLGFYTYLHWPVLAAAVGATLIFWAANKGMGKNFLRVKILLSFLLPCACLLLPLALWISGEGLDQMVFYLRHLSAGNPAVHPNEQINISLSYITSLFWGMDLKYHTYQPVFGGYLNPLMGSLFFMGLIEVIPRLKNRFYQWLLASLPFFLLPGILTSERATSRMVLAFPILAVLVVLGLGRLLSDRPRRNVLILSLILVIAAGLDFFHLFAAYPAVWKSLDNWNGYGKSYTRYQAFLRLEKLSKTQGPGYLFSDFVPGLSDQTLSVADFRINLSNPQGLTSGPVPWVGLLANANLIPFLKKSFPTGQAWWISKDIGSPEGGWMLWVIPGKDLPAKIFRRWFQASAALKLFIEKSLLYVPGQSLEPMEMALRKIHSLFQSDPLLETYYFEKMADLSTRKMITGCDPSSGPEAYQAALLYLKTAIQKGYPSAHLFFKMGTLYSIQGKIPEAKECFRKARGALVDLTQASTYEKLLPPSGEHDEKP